jgi:hypothetical protein
MLSAGLRFVRPITNNNIYEFYNDPQKKAKGCNYTYSEVIGFDVIQLELRHDYVQFLLPTKTPSQYNRNVDVLTDDIINLMKSNKCIMSRLDLAVTTMITFWGSTLEIINVDNNHNHLRISRCIECIGLFDLTDRRLELLDLIGKLDKASKTSKDNWNEKINKHWDK